MSIPDAAKVLNDVKLATSMLPVPPGKLNVTKFGTWKVPADTGARQEKLPLTPLAGSSDVPVISTKEPGAPPVQVTSNPLARLTVASESWLVQLRSGLGKVKGALKLPTFAPPLPLKVNAPPEVGMNPDGNSATETPGAKPPGMAASVALPEGPVTVMVPASSPVLVLVDVPSVCEREQLPSDAKPLPV